jgi:transketolase
MAVTDSQLETLNGMSVKIRQAIVTMMGPNKAHHFGGSLSAADVLVGLYFYAMNVDPHNPQWPARDRFIMSKGHSVPAQYAALALKGFFPMEELKTLKKLGSRLQGHPAMHYTPGIEGCTGALGEGLSFANGMALAARLSGLDYRVYCLIGDGEMQEGQVWEGAMSSAHMQLGSLTAIVDRNHLKAMDEPDSSKQMDPLCERWASFGWLVREINGHDMRQICDALDWSADPRPQPAVIIAHTVKGQGISFMENQARFHNAAITPEQYEESLRELAAQREEGAPK